MQHKDNKLLIKYLKHQWDEHFDNDIEPVDLVILDVTKESTMLIKDILKVINKILIPKEEFHLEDFLLDDGKYHIDDQILLEYLIDRYNIINE
jgi:hypothetical protein